VRQETLDVARRTVARVSRTVATPAEDVVTMDKIVALCKRRGFIFQSSEIYGGLGSTYDYGHYGVLVKSNVKSEWWRAVLQERAAPNAAASCRSHATST
jgi:hypothetical protein